MDKELLDYGIKLIGSPEEYCDFEGMDIRLAVMKANDLYYTISDARVELSYVDKEYYEMEGFDNDFVRYIHLKNAIQDLNRMYDISLQIPWFLYRIWTEERVFKDKIDKAKAKNIIRNSENWVNNSEDICKDKYVKRYLKFKKTAIHNEILELLDSFTKEFIFNENKETIRSLCNYIKHKGNILPEEIKGKTNFKFSINNEAKEIDGVLLVPKNWKVPNIPNLSNLWKVPNIVFNNGKEFTIDFIYNSKKENFYGSDLIKKSLSIDNVYSECINYLKAFKPIYDLYIIMLKEYICRFMREPEINNSSSINLNELYQKK
ncbi:hypothetical protein SR42_15830 [Clostridium botulinum]|uniref:hypothetical protein n=1 Tax=Clostridium botulinum TaxID=1491 RepID=UPI000596E4A6|nr:hypothetical protein [Clostridium botulinum]KIL06609.1 hypothetical protein SR42_15830 [Clostridium botulinum]MBY6934534.1 hypothetical protein [Clostridium botulinum]NFL83509.1 hypothetical protein [Clostridium botulinum]NFN11864.1 hypothetical protein [Clostridium botulinum]NFO36389.1 hypothetical protein [Clostridium botulinum]